MARYRAYDRRWLFFRRRRAVQLVGSLPRLVPFYVQASGTRYSWRKHVHTHKYVNHAHDMASSASINAWQGAPRYADMGYTISNFPFGLTTSNMYEELGQHNVPWTGSKCELCEVDVGGSSASAEAELLLAKFGQRTFPRLHTLCRRDRLDQPF